uniref:Uncharacterized protein n=1 Tax=Rhizophora mucronata TaxID=61149 RepID=A0A2P2PPD5_RHIMU
MFRAMNPLPLTAKVAERNVVQPSIKFRLPEMMVLFMPSPTIMIFHFFFLISTYSLYTPRLI